MLYKEQFYAELKRKFVEMSIYGKKYENRLNTLCLDVNKKFGFPLGMISDVVTLRVDMSAALEVLLYAIASMAEINVETYFSPKEIKEYSKYKYQVTTIKFPFTFESTMVEIKPDEQYIGRITVKELMKLRDAQVINYNANTQRALTFRRGKDFEYYKITLNHKAVEQIADLLKKGDYIPNTLTFNISPETDFTYKNGKLTINESVAFDILDGYHRYIAMSNLYNIDENFDYPMEIRIMFLSEEDAKQFIYQEDQRTPLAKADANAKNKNDLGVKVCRFIKNNLGSDIVSQSGIINESLLVKMIDLLYAKPGMSYERSKILELSNAIIKAINDVLAEVPTLLDTKWSTNYTVIFLALVKQAELKGKALNKKVNELKNKLSKEVRIEQLTLKKVNALLNS